MTKAFQVAEDGNLNRPIEMAFNRVNVLSTFKRAATLTGQFPWRVLARSRECIMSSIDVLSVAVLARMTAKRNNETANRRILRARGSPFPLLSFPFPLLRSSVLFHPRTRM